MHLLTEPPCRTPTLLNLEFIGSNHPPASVAEIRRTNPCWILSSKFLSLPAPPISKSYPSLPVLIPSAAQTSQVWLRPEPVPVLLSPSEKLTVNSEAGVVAGPKSVAPTGLFRACGTGMDCHRFTVEPSCLSHKDLQGTDSLSGLPFFDYSLPLPGFLASEHLVTAGTLRAGCPRSELPSSPVGSIAVSGLRDFSCKDK